MSDCLGEWCGFCTLLGDARQVREKIGGEGVRLDCRVLMMWVFGPLLFCRSFFFFFGVRRGMGKTAYSREPFMRQPFAASH